MPLSLEVRESALVKPLLKLCLSVIEIRLGRQYKLLTLFSIKTHGPNYRGKLTQGKSVPCPKWSGCNLHLMNRFYSSICMSSFAYNFAGVSVFLVSLNLMYVLFLLPDTNVLCILSPSLIDLNIERPFSFST